MPANKFENVKAKYNQPAAQAVYSGTDNDTLQQLQALQRGSTQAIVLPKGEKIVVRGCEFTQVGLVIPDNLAEDDWKYVVQSIARLEAALQWMVGDLWAFAMAHYGGRAELATLTKKSEKTLSNWASVCRAFPDQSSRQRELSFTHHAEVAGREDAQELLQQAIEGEWTAAELREVIQGKPEKTDAWTKFETSSILKAQKVDAKQRKLMASRFRQLADKIEALKDNS